MQEVIFKKESFTVFSYMVVPNREKSGNFINKKYSKSGNQKTIKNTFFNAILKNNLANWLNLARKTCSSRGISQIWLYRSDSKVEYFQRLEVSQGKVKFFFLRIMLCVHDLHQQNVSIWRFQEKKILEIWQFWVYLHQIFFLSSRGGNSQIKKKLCSQQTRINYTTLLVTIYMLIFIHISPFITIFF